jgi:hypothetical protein
MTRCTLGSMYAGKDGSGTKKGRNVNGWRMVPAVYAAIGS